MSVSLPSPRRTTAVRAVATTALITVTGLLLSSCTTDAPLEDPSNASETVSNQTTPVEDSNSGLPHDALQ